MRIGRSVMKTLQPFSKGVKMEEINFENFTKSLQTQAPQGRDGDMQVKRILQNMSPQQKWFIKSLTDGEVMFAIGILGLTYTEVANTLRLYADMLERSVKICEERL